MTPGSAYNTKRMVWITVLLTTITAPNILNFYWIPGPLQLARIIFGAILVALPIVFFKLKPRIYLTFLLPVFLLEYMDIVHMLNYGKHFSVGAVASFFYTDSKEAIEFLWHTSTTTLPTILAIAVIAIYLYITAPATLPKLKPFFQVTLLASTVSFPFFFDMKWAFPNSAASEIYGFYQLNQKFNAQLAKRHFLRYEMIGNSAAEDGIFVLVLGETVYKKHLGLYGYDRNTTPNLSNRPNIVVFNDVTAPANLTQNSVSLLLTPATAKDPSLFYKYQSVIGLANAAGFDTYWLSNQSKFNRFNNEVSVLAEEAKHKVFKDTGLSGSLDGGLLVNLDKALQDAGKKKFILLHMLGSHVDYAQRYPENFNKFTDRPLLAKVDNPKVFQMINTYDNSILYTDYVLDQVISRIETQNINGCVVFLADHGEYLSNTRPISGHGYPVALRQEAEIPLLVWCSEKYRQLHPETINTIIKNKVHLTFAWVKGTLSRMSCNGDERWKAKNCIGTCWG